MNTKQFSLLALFASLAATAGAMEEDNRSTKVDLLDDWTVVEEEGESMQQQGLYGLAVEAALNQGNMDMVERLFEEQRRGTKLDFYHTADGQPVFEFSTNGPIVIKQTEPQQAAQKPISIINNNNNVSLSADGNGGSASTELVRDKQQDDGDTVLHLAIRSGDAELVGNLIDTDHMLCFTPNNLGLTALHIAAGQGHAEIVQLLIAYGAPIDAQTKTGDTPLHLAVKHPEVVKCLLDCGAPVDAVTLDGDTPLHTAAFWRQLEAAKLLLQCKAPVDAATSDGTTALHTAAETGQAEFVTLLIESKAQVNKQRNDGMNALRLAATNGHNDIIKSLLEAKESLIF